MKKIIILVVIIGALFALFFISSGGEIDVTPTPNSAGNTFKPDMSNATFIFEDENVTLSNGIYSGKLDKESEVNGEVYLSEFIDYGDLNGDKKEDAAGLLVQSGGGSGVFVYIVAYTSGNVSYKGSNALFVGDRVSPQKIDVSNGIITVTYLDRKDDEPFAAEPTIITTKSFVYRSGELQER